MHKNSGFARKRDQKDVIIAEIRQKPVISQAIFVKLLGVEWVNREMSEWVNG